MAAHPHGQNMGYSTIIIGGEDGGDDACSFSFDTPNKKLTASPIAVVSEGVSSPSRYPKEGQGDAALGSIAMTKSGCSPLNPHHVPDKALGKARRHAERRLQTFLHGHTLNNTTMDHLRPTESSAPRTLPHTRREYPNGQFMGRSDVIPAAEGLTSCASPAATPSPTTPTKTKTKNTTAAAAVNGGSGGHKTFKATKQLLFGCGDSDDGRDANFFKRRSASAQLFPHEQRMGAESSSPTATTSKGATSVNRQEEINGQRLNSSPFAHRNRNFDPQAMLAARIKSQRQSFGQSTLNFGHLQKAAKEQRSIRAKKTHSHSQKFGFSNLDLHDDDDDRNGKKPNDQQSQGMGVTAKECGNLNGQRMGSSNIVLG
mmetsp:Transcript_52824/g.104846  ORF Transcript_52824/g.104846 Transcript_52824/m.104846 type:complete len:371 (-) Transcript_52824:380-1492(-)